MQQIYFRSCLWGILMSFWIFLFVLLLLIKLGIISFSAYYNYEFQKECLISNYVPYLSIPSSTSTPIYNSNIAKALMTVCYNVSMSNCSNLGPLPLPPQFDITHQLVGTSADNIQRMFGYVLISSKDNIAVIVFTGTSFLDEWQEDFNIDQTAPTYLHNYTNGILMHSGFSFIYSSLKAQITSLLSGLSVNTLYITGHSLGGALATVCAFDLAGIQPTPIVYTFASPRVFNIQGAIVLNHMLPNIQRVYNTEDLVPTGPPAIIFNTLYQHTGMNIPFTVNLETEAMNHVNSYMKYLP